MKEMELDDKITDEMEVIKKEKLEIDIKCNNLIGTEKTYRATERVSFKLWSGTIFKMYWIPDYDRFGGSVVDTRLKDVVEL